MESHVSEAPPSPTETSYRTPSSSLSRRSPYEDMSPSSTPPPLPTDIRIAKKKSHDSQLASDENISPLDPRRFTPTLHASLVSEILSLRRDLESKTKSIELLEQSLDTAQTQNEGLSKNLLTSNKEIRSVKRQMQLLEGGTLSAINDLSKERDDAVQESADLRKRLEQTQKRARNHESNADYTQSLWEKDKESWAAERRALEAKSHIAENRLKTVLEEIEKVQQQQPYAPTQYGIVSKESIVQRPESRSSVPGSPTGVRYRRQSAASINSDHNGGRMSGLGLIAGHVTSLADELALDDIEEDIVNEEGRISPDALPEENPRPSSSLSIKARKVLGLSSDIEQLENEEKLPSKTEISSEEATFISASKAEYIDSAVQYSPPPSPIDSSPSDDEECSSVDSESTAKRRSIISNTPAMVSSSCQTIEQLPSPPLTPKNDGLGTILESPFEKPDTKDMATQTDLQPRPGASKYIHSRTSTHDLGIPTIAIIPPTSRPTTPIGNVVLPPHTKNAGCQVDPKIVYNYTTSSMQTEEIRVDRRNILASNLLNGTSVSNQVQSSTSKGKASVYPRKATSQPQPVSNSSSKRSAPQNPPIPPINDNGPLAMDSSLASSRPVRSSSLFAGFDDALDELEDELDDDIFYDDDFSNKPTAKFTLRSGKLVSQENNLEDIGEVAAVSAGEAVALDNLRRSESTLPPELRQFGSPERMKSLKPQNAIRRAPSATKPTNVRRAAMISSGVAVHQSKLSQSTVDSESIDGAMPPPLPIPLRYSSARIGKSYSEGGRNSRGSSNTSPTRQYRQKYRPVLRKARSGPAISPAGGLRRPRSKSPPLDSRVSIVPEMPHFQMPIQLPVEMQPSVTSDFAETTYEAGAPRPAIATGPRRTQNHLKQTSDPGLLQQTSVVDAIAQTMVGEWMYKYVRRRKSFGKPEKDWDPTKSVEELTSNPASAGVRHKRWVWLAPYERAVMWSSKQPMNGTALLGKSGRKLTVKSVLDVKDDNPMPKNSLTGPAFNRSILILTPQRALKFTATNQERHFVWLTALSFLSHSPLSIGDLAALPPPPEEYRSPSPPPVPVGGSFRRRTLRDSIRIAKGPSRQDGHRPVNDSGPPTEQYSNTRPPTRDYYDPESDAALPPTIKRFHTRNRSNTAPRPGLGTFTSFSHRDVNPNSPIEFLAHERGQFSPGIGNPSIPSSRRGSEASNLGKPMFNKTYSNYTPPTGFSFSDSSHNASMTMRMDAFIDNKHSGKGGPKNLRLNGPPRTTNKDLSYWGFEEGQGPVSPVSPVDSFSAANASIRLSDSTGRGSVERDFFKAF